MSASNPIVILDDEGAIGSSPLSSPLSSSQGTLAITVILHVVGQHAFHNVAVAGETLSLVREPRNKFDKNAVRVDNKDREGIGHVPKREAKVLAPVLDGLLLRVEEMSFCALVGTDNRYSRQQPFRATFVCAGHDVDALHQHFEENGLDVEVV